jgi:large subunit ribosomal protein L11
MKVKLIVEGGKMAPGPAVAQQLGPMGINLGKVISDVNEATKSFAGTKVPVELDVNPKDKSFEIQVFSPPTSELIKKSLSIEKGSGEPHKYKAGNVAIETLIGIAKTKSSDLLAKDLKSALKLMVGSCVSAGILVDNKEAKEIEADIDAGKYDSEIKEEKTTPDPQKAKKLQLHFKKVFAAQEALKKEEAAAEAAEEAAKEAKAKAAEAGEESAEALEGEDGEEGEASEATEGEAPAEEAKPDESKK